MAAPRESATLEIEKLTPAAIAAYLNNGMNAEPPTARFQIVHQPRRPGYAKRYPTEASALST